MLNSNDIIILFADFKKAFNSADRKIVDGTIREFSVKSKLANQSHETITDTVSKVRSMGEISKPFKVNIDVRQSGGLSQILFTVS